jgi:hypothetical protein
MRSAVCEGAPDLGVDFFRAPRPARVVVRHFGRRIQQRLQRQSFRNATSAGERPDTEAFGVEGQLLLTSRGS